MLEITLRLVASLAVVVGLLLLLARVGGRRFRGAPGAVVRVLYRQPLSRSSAISVVAIGGRVLVLGSTEQQINVLTELDPRQLDTQQLDLQQLDREPSDPADAPDFATTLAQVRSLPAPPVATPRRTAGAHRAAHPAEPPSVDRSRLQGSILSVQTWRQAFAASRRAS